MNEHNTTQSDPASSLTGRPSSGGLRAALAGLAAVKVPSWRSVAATASCLLAGVTSVATAIVLVDRSLLGGHLRSGLAGARTVVGLGALVALMVAVALSVMLPINANDVDRLLTAGQRRRLHVAISALVTALCLGYLWSLGAAR